MLEATADAQTDRLYDCWEWHHETAQCKGKTKLKDIYFPWTLPGSVRSVTTVARKRPRSFCPKSRWQVTAKYAYTLCMWLCMKWHGAWLYGVHRTHREGSSFMWHQQCQRCKYTTLVDSQKCAIKSYSLMQNHTQVQWVCLRAENSTI